MVADFRRGGPAWPLQTGEIGRNVTLALRFAPPAGAIVRLSTSLRKEVTHAHEHRSRLSRFNADPMSRGGRAEQAGGPRPPGPVRQPGQVRTGRYRLAAGGPGRH